MQLQPNTHGQYTRSFYARALFCGLVTALAFGASSAQAADEFRTSFEVHLGQALAHNFADVVFNLHRPHHVRYVPEFYTASHRGHRSRGHHYEPHHYRARHVHHVGCDHWTSHRRGHRDRYVHHEERIDHGRNRDRHGRDRDRHDRGRRERHS